MYARHIKPVVSETTRNDFHAAIANDFLPFIEKNTSAFKAHNNLILEFARDIDHNKYYIDTLIDVTDVRYWVLSKNTSPTGYFVTSKPDPDYSPYNNQEINASRREHGSVVLELSETPTSSERTSIPTIIAKEWEIGLKGSGGAITEHALHLAGINGLVSTVPVTPKSENYNEYLGFQNTAYGQLLLDPVTRPDLWEIKDQENKSYSYADVQHKDPEKLFSYHWQSKNKQGGYLQREQ